MTDSENVRFNYLGLFCIYIFIFIFFIENQQKLFAFRLIGHILFMMNYLCFDIEIQQVRKSKRNTNISITTINRGKKTILVRIHINTTLTAHIQPM